MISFSNITFIFRFLPAFLIVFYVTPVKFRTWTLLLGSLIFYLVGSIDSVGNFKMFPALLGAVVVNYLFARAVRNAEGKKKKVFLALIVIFDAVMLITFKLLGQFVDGSLIPIGISFYTFKMISFQADSYNGKIDSKPLFKDVAAYFCMFPQVVSGPIMRFSDYSDNLELIPGASKSSKEEILANIEDGFKYFIAGLAMKVLLADHYAMLWKEIGTIGYESISTPFAWIGAVTYSLQLFFDFWGYSLMSSGIAVMLGFPFVVNFDHPYGSASVSEFYRRWHATLGSWFRDYIYIPMGGSRVGTVRIILNLLVVWLVTGFWHGVTLNFILWGIILFVIIMCERFIVFKLPGVLKTIVGRFNVLVLIPLTWVIFAISDAGMLLNYFKRLFPFFGAGIAVNDNDYIKNLGIYGGLLGVGVVLLIPNVFKFIEKHRKNPLIMICLFVLFWFSVYSLTNSAGNPFMYFAF
ncbi:MAG: MBOAT family protein [Butyrivibrio sp.]|nr:MBOAT family protein [Butyrivibrio sp.]